MEKEDAKTSDNVVLRVKSSEDGVDGRISVRLLKARRSAKDLDNAKERDSEQESNLTAG